jgi:glycosyltransferase involved in cell wall biosynthesis
MIPTEEMYNYINQAKVGLCLSADEGAMYASAEYLLCGLPVVSTRSIGGRDTFFDDEYVKIVDDTPEAVSEGVREMICRNINPYYIREKTIEKMKSHRGAFIAMIQAIYDKEGVKRHFSEEWSKIFVNKLLLRQYEIKI